jgi:thiaminase
MTQAMDVMRDTRTALEEREAEIREHRYFPALGSGRVPVDALRAFPGHQYHMWRSDMRSAAALVQRFGDRPYGGFFNDALQGEIAAGPGIVSLARRLGMTKEDLENYEPSAEGFAYAGYFAWLSIYGSAAEVACALTVNLAAWGHNCGQMSEALRAHYGFGTKDTEFLDAFAALPSLDEPALVIIQDDLDHGIAPRRIVWAARLMQAYEKMFWDAMASAADAAG